MPGTVIVVGSVALVSGAQNVKREADKAASSNELAKCEPASD